MQEMLSKLMDEKLATFLILVLWIALLAARIVLPKPDEDARGGEVWIEIAWLLLLLVYLYILFAGFGLGRIAVDIYGSKYLPAWRPSSGNFCVD